MASTYLTRNTGSSGTSGKKFTISFWMKCADVSNSITMFGASSNATGSPFMLIQRTSGGRLRFSDYTNDTTTRADKTTTRLLRDPSAFYNIVIAVDTDQSTPSERNRIYINGVEETSFNTDTNYSSGATTSLGQNNEMVLGRYEPYNSNYFDGIISHFHYVDGQQYAPTVFGETDATTGEWKIKTNVTATYGTNGFFILKDGNSVTDQSGNSNNFTVGGGTLTNTEDNPSNVFATFNPLIAQTGATFTKGNTVVYRTTSGNYRRIGCTLGATSGKYYAEFLLGASQWGGVCLTNGGDIARTEAGSAGYMGEYAGDYSVGIRNDGIVYSNGANVSSAQWDQGSMSTSDRLCLALDLDNKKLFLGKNGVWNVSSNPATNTGGISLGGDSYTFCGATSNADCMINAGNGYMGTTAISSEGTNASGIGKFEYDVPAGYTALSTKGLNE